MNLYELDQEYQKVLDECLYYSELNEGLVDDDLASRLGEVSDNRNNKIEAVALYIKSQVAMEAAIAKEIKALQERKKRIKSKYEWLKTYLANIVDGKFETAKVKISFRKSEALSYAEDFFAENLPTELQTIKITPCASAIKSRIQSGKEVEGVALVEKKNIQIK